MGMFSIFLMSSSVIFSAAFGVFPISFSVSMEAEAWLIAQPFPQNVAFVIFSFPVFLSFSIFRFMRILSPQSGLSSLAQVVASGRGPSFLGFL